MTRKHNKSGGGSQTIINGLKFEKKKKMLLNLRTLVILLFRF